MAEKPGRSRQGPAVLNAFRHHRGGHCPQVENRIIQDMCSTPFGITEGGIPFFQLNRRFEGCAQRLSASQRGAYAATGGEEAKSAVVLNAFRHHRGGHGCDGG